MGNRNHKRYDDEFRASAVLMLEAAGYPGREGALSHVAGHLSVPRSTLQGWFSGAHNPPPPKVRHEKKIDLIKALTSLLHLHIEAGERVIVDSDDLRAIDTGIGILVDKLQLLTGGDTDRGALRIEYINDWRGELDR
jgi:hypothetical protein